MPTNRRNLDWKLVRHRTTRAYDRWEAVHGELKFTFRAGNAANRSVTVWRGETGEPLTKVRASSGATVQETKDWLAEEFDLVRALQADFNAAQRAVEEARKTLAGRESYAVERAKLLDNELARR